jgi:hypothetical protein
MDEEIKLSPGTDIEEYKKDMSKCLNEFYEFQEKWFDENQGKNSADFWDWYLTGK